MGLEGLVSKHKDRPYRPGRSQHWVKVKNRQHPAFSRVRARSGASIASSPIPSKQNKQMAGSKASYSLRSNRGGR